MQQTSDSATRQVILYRMALPDHVCPFGLKALDMLAGSGYEVDDRVLGTREEVDAFKAEHGVATTPQAFVDGQRIGGSSDLSDWLAQQH